MSTPLRAVGYWFEAGFGERWPDPTLLVDPGWCTSERSTIVAYLRSAPRSDEASKQHLRMAKIENRTGMG